MIGSLGVSKISVVSTCMGRYRTFNFVFHVSPTACMDTWTYRTRNKIITSFRLPFFSERCNFLCYKQSRQLNSADTETWIRRKYDDKKGNFLCCRKEKVIFLRPTETVQFVGPVSAGSRLC